MNTERASSRANGGEGGPHSPQTRRRDCKAPIDAPCRGAGKRGRCGHCFAPKGVLDTGRAETMAGRYNGGETLQAIADDYGITRERVRQILRKFGVPSLGNRPEHRSHPHELTADEIEAAQLYDEGVRPKELTERFGLTYAQITTAVERCGYDVKGNAYWRTRDDDADLTATIAKLYKQGLSAREIVELEPRIRFPETVYRYLKKAGVAARRPIRRGYIDRYISTIRALTALGNTQVEIAKAIGASTHGVFLAMKRHGIKPSRGQAHHEARSKGVS